jgi:hypothetical protein
MPGVCIRLKLLIEKTFPVEVAQHHVLLESSKIRKEQKASVKVTAPAAQAQVTLMRLRTSHI